MIRRFTLPGSGADGSGRGARVDAHRRSDAAAGVSDAADGVSGGAGPRRATRAVAVAGLGALALAGVATPAAGAAGSTGTAAETSALSALERGAAGVGAAGARAAGAGADRRGSQFHRSAVSTRYRWARVSPTRLPDGTPTGSTLSVGIDDDGRVTGNAVDQRLAFRSGRSSGWLDTTGLTYGVTVGAISPQGQVVGRINGSTDRFASWALRGRLGQVKTASSGYGPIPSAINSSGLIAGIHAGVKTSSLFVARGGTVTTLSVAREGNYRVTGLSEGGVGTATRDNPSTPNDGRYPQGVVFGAGGVSDVRADAASAVDGISPNGRYVVGRVGAYGQDPQQVAWLSTRRAPSPLPGARGLRPRDVSDRGVVVGSVDGRAALWSQGTLVDLGSRVSLPRGWALADASGINDRGEIAVDARVPDLGYVSLKLSPR